MARGKAIGVLILVIGCAAFLAFQRSNSTGVSGIKDQFQDSKVLKDLLATQRELNRLKSELQLIRNQSHQISAGLNVTKETKQPKEEHELVLSTQPLLGSRTCIGGDFTPNSWKKRSCRYTNLCFNTSETNHSFQFIYYKSPEEKSMEFESLVGEGDGVTVSLPPINQQWNTRWDYEIKWKPVEREGPLLEPHFMLKSSDVWLIYMSFCGANIGHLLWDEFLPWYQLPLLFGLGHLNRKPLRVVVDDPPWATCDWIKNDPPLPGYYDRCINNYARWLPAMLSHPLDTTENFHRDPPLAKPLVCFPQAVVGMGNMGDHCQKNHGQGADEHKEYCNQGRGPILWDWRNYMIDNLGLRHLDPPFGPEKPRVIIFPFTSLMRGRDFKAIRKALEDKYPGQVAIGDPASWDAKKQVEECTKSTVYISVVGGGTATAAFLPRHSSLILYHFAGDEGRLDWDLWTNTAYIKTYWLTFDQYSDTDMAVRIVDLAFANYEAARSADIAAAAAVSS